MTTTEDMTLKGPVGDLRHEKFRKAGPPSGRIRAPFVVPSPNLAAFYGLLAPDAKLGKLRVIADKTERGETLTDDEDITLYESVSMLLNCVEDLAGMCLRREEALADCDVRIGAK